MEAVPARLLAARGLVRDAPAAILVAQREVAVQPVGRGAGAVLQIVERLGADHLVVEIGDDVGPGLALGVVRVHVDDELVVEIALVRLAPGAGQDLARVGRDVDLPDRVLPEGLQS